MSSLPRQGSPYEHQENLEEHQGGKEVLTAHILDAKVVLAMELGN